MRRLGWVVLALLLASAATADVYEADDPTGAWIAPGENLSRNFTSSDLDYLRFNVTDGRKYEILFSGEGSIDGELFTYRSNGDLLAYSDDDLRDVETPDPRVRFIAGETGTMTMTLREFNGANGSYSIALIERGTLASSFSLNASQVRVDDSFTATINLTCTDGPCGNVTVILDPYVDPVAKQYPDGDVVVRTSEGERIVRSEEPYTDRIPAQVRERLAQVPNENALAVLAERGLLADDVQAVYGLLRVHTMLDESVPYLGAPGLWNESYGSGSICVIDTGVDYTHPALGGCDRTSNISDGSCDVVIGGYDFENGDADPYDDDGHGTHVAGIVASRDATYRGVAPNATIVAVKALDEFGGGSYANVVDAVHYCEANRERFNITSIVMSLGTDTIYHGYCDRLFGSANVAAVAQQIPTFVAAGNQHNSYEYNQSRDDAAGGLLGDPFLAHAWPGCVPNVIPVGSIDLTESVSSFSNRELSTVFAPGQSIRSTHLNDTFSSRSGTSMAAPHGAGAAILLNGLWEQRYANELAPSSIRYLLELGDSIADPFSNTQYTRINVSKSAGFKGVVPTTPGSRPFWTSSSNPQYCDLDANESCTLEWTVTAEGPKGNYVFFAFLEDEFDIETSPNSRILVSEFKSITYDPAPRNDVLAIGSYNATITLREDASTGWIVIDAPGSSNDVNERLTLINSTVFSFNRTIVEGEDGSEDYTLIFTIDGSNVTVEHDIDLSIDATYPNASAPDTLSATGSFLLDFDEEMDTSNVQISFPTAAQVSFNISWMNATSFNVSYAVSNASFDEVINLLSNLSDPAGNRAFIPSLRLDAQRPVLNVTTNASNISSGSIMLVVNSSENLTSLALSTTLTCAFDTSSVSSVTYSCTAPVATESNAPIVVNASDPVGNRAIGNTTILIDTLAPRVENVSIVSRTGASASFTVSFNESSVPISLSTGDELSSSGSIVIASASTRTIDASDAFNNTASFGLTVTYDDTPPRTTINTTGDWQQGSVAVGFDVEETNIYTTRVRFSNATTTTGNFTRSSEGEHRFEYRSVDEAGNREGWKSATVRIDDTSPTVAVYPARDASGTFITIEASDAASGISSVLVNGSQAARTGSLWTARVNGSANVSVTDRAGNVDERIVSIPSLPAVFSDPANGTRLNGSIELTFVGDELNYTLSNATSGSTNASIIFVPSEGAFTISGNVTDNVTVEPFTLSFVIDRTAPSIAVTAPSSSDGIVRVNVSASDPALDRVEIAKNGSTVANGSSSASYELDPLSDGTGLVNITFSAYDLAGNVNTTSRIVNLSLPNATNVTAVNGTAAPDRSGIGSYVRSIAGLDSNVTLAIASSAPGISTIDVTILNLTIIASTPGTSVVELAIPSSAPANLALWRISSGSSTQLSYTNVSSEERLRIIRFSTNGFSDFVIGTEYDTCSEGAVSSSCTCGGSVVSSGYCCSGSAQSTSCTPDDPGGSGGSSGGSGGSGSSFVSSLNDAQNETNATEGVDPQPLNVTVNETNVTFENDTEPVLIENSTAQVNVSAPVTGDDRAPIVGYVLTAILGTFLVAILLVVLKRRGVF